MEDRGMFWQWIALGALAVVIVGGVVWFEWDRSQGLISDFQVITQKKAMDQDWQRAKAQSTIAAFQAYLRAYSTGAYAEAAETAIVAIRKTEERYKAALAKARETASRARPATKTTIAIDGLDQTRYALKGLNVRSGPGATFAKVGRLEPGASVEVTGKVKGKDWYRIALGGRKSGYVFGRLLGQRAAPGVQQAAGSFPGKPPAPAKDNYEPGDAFKDCGTCPEMVVVPAGSYFMGLPVTDKKRLRAEHPKHWAHIAEPFAVGRFEVTFAEWDACLAGGGCNGYRPFDRGWGRGLRPVIEVSWNDAKAYVAWLKYKTGKSYRLLSETEWEYVVRAGTKTRYWWGKKVGIGHALCQSCDSPWDRDQRTVPVGSFPANRFGLHDVAGNVSEWVEDCWNYGYENAPWNGGPWLSGDCGKRVQRGGSVFDKPESLRSATRGWRPTSNRFVGTGFRIARALN